MSRARVKLRADSNSVVVTIPRPLLIYTGLLPGEEVILELLEDSSIRIRRYTAADIPPSGSPKLVYDHTEPRGK